ncbi:14434_t:CDS:2 [Acaulospora morrowiae]|uniref:14434_t:CDS:1 n=1 Tax=Acaulospora morrowiae TaxID=94023 RepID=A0A9N9BBQ8_9GLOM|nr:14434_t:CDS:2 [Acaulospora morrowiae]
MVSTKNALILKSSGNPMPFVGLGLWQVPKDKAADVVFNGLQIGYRLLDNASDYGNEKEVGDGIKKAIEHGIVKREDIFVTSKLWNTNHKREHVRPALERTLKDLGLDYLDLYLIHFPVSLEYVDPSVRYPAGWFGSDENVTARETWEAMEELVDAGLVKNIGLSNFSAALIYDLLKYARIRPAVLQIEHHPYLTQENLIKYMKSQEIAVTAYSSLGTLSFQEFDGEYGQRALRTPSLLKQDIVLEVAASHKRTPAQVLLRWSVQRGIAVIPKSNKHERLVENMNIFDFSLTEEELRRISSLDRRLRFNDPAVFADLPIFD